MYEAEVVHAFSPQEYYLRGFHLWKLLLTERINPLFCKLLAEERIDSVKYNRPGRKKTMILGRQFTGIFK